MDAAVSTVIDGMASTTLGLITDVVTSYWGLILGLIVMVAIAIRLKRSVGVAK